MPSIIPAFQLARQTKCDPHHPRPPEIRNHVISCTVILLGLRRQQVRHMEHLLPDHPKAASGDRRCDRGRRAAGQDARAHLHGTQLAGRLHLLPHLPGLRLPIHHRLRPLLQHEHLLAAAHVHLDRAADGRRDGRRGRRRSRRPRSRKTFPARRRRMPRRRHRRLHPPRASAIRRPHPPHRRLGRRQSSRHRHPRHPAVFLRLSAYPHRPRHRRQRPARRLPHAGRHAPRRSLRHRHRPAAAYPHEPLRAVRPRRRGDRAAHRRGARRPHPRNTIYGRPERCSGFGCARGSCPLHQAGIGPASQDYVAIGARRCKKSMDRELQDNPGGAVLGLCNGYQEV